MLYTLRVPLRPSGRLVLFVLAVTLAVGGAIVVLGPYGQLTAASGGLEPPETRVGATMAEIAAFLQGLGPDGRGLYTRALWWDFLNALLIPGALGLVILWLVHRLPDAWNFLRWLVAIPAGVAVADVLENALLLTAVAAFPGPASDWVPAVTTTKLTLGLTSVPVVIVLAVMALLLKGSRARR